MQYVQHEQTLRELGLSSQRCLLALPLAVTAAHARAETSERHAIRALATEHFSLNAEGSSQIAKWFEHPPAETYWQRGLRALRDIADDPKSPVVQADDLVASLLLCEAVARSLGDRAGHATPSLDTMAAILGIDRGQRWEEVLAELELSSELDSESIPQIGVGVTCSPPKPRQAPSDETQPRKRYIPLRTYLSALRQAQAVSAGDVEPPFGMV